jgi:hypothetical protein
MPEATEIPNDLKKPYARLIDLIPVPFKYEEQVQKDILLFLKLEGEAFVRNKIEQSREVFSKRKQQE